MNHLIYAQWYQQILAILWYWIWRLLVNDIKFFKKVFILIIFFFLEFYNLNFHSFFGLGRKKKVLRGNICSRFISIQNRLRIVEHFLDISIFIYSFSFKNIVILFLVFWFFFFSNDLFDDDRSTIYWSVRTSVTKRSDARVVRRVWRPSPTS